MRIGECLGLRWEDVDFENRIISVNHNLTDRPVGKERKIERHIQSTKTEAGMRSIPIVDEVMDAFKGIRGFFKIGNETYKCSIAKGKWLAKYPGVPLSNHLGKEFDVEITQVNLPQDSLTVEFI